MRALEEQVKTDGACTLPGVSIAYELFMPIMMRAVARGYVRQEHADFVANGLRFGFDLGVDVSKLRGRRLFRNYPTALEARAAVIDSLEIRAGGAGRRRRPAPCPNVQRALSVLLIL